MDEKNKLIINLEIHSKKQENKLESLEKNLLNLESKMHLLRQDYDIVLKEKILLEGQLKQLQIGVKV